ncbi:MAG: hypothetical protein NC907_00690 [Candidatus Omnitrophica bacterium]|nr:hypothetical protein [Candidatus Omnitrophota bacterium]
MKKFVLFLFFNLVAFFVFAQQSDVIKSETQTQFKLEEFEIIHLSSGVIGETNIQIQPQPQQSSPQGLSKEERELAIRKLQEIRTAMRKIEENTIQQNPELKSIMDKISELQNKKKALIDEALADNFEYQQLKQKIASGDFQASDTMRLAGFERQATQDQRIRDIDQEIRNLYQQRQTLLQKALVDNQEYQSRVAESQSIMQSFGAFFQRPDQSTTTQTIQNPSSTGAPRRWQPNTGASERSDRSPGNPPWRRQD